MLPIQTTNKTKRNKVGLSKKCNSAFLIPIEPENENIKGIYHLFEHILISKLLSINENLFIRGCTTEDYIILFCKHLNLSDIIETLKKFKNEPGELELNKKILMDEITRKANNEEEEFFRFVWKDTHYEKSPLGDTNEVNRITILDMEDLRAKILQKNLFLFEQNKNLVIVNKGETDNYRKEKLNIHVEKGRIYKNKSYDISYFNDRIEEMYLLEKIMQNQNQDYHIQLSEKKNLSALIIEAGTNFPNESNISSLKKTALKEIKKELKCIKNNFTDRAINELESFYFYGKHWAERIKILFQTGDKQLLEIVNIIKLSGKEK